MKERVKMKSKIIAHRGMSTLAPENTLSAFELMPQYKINWLETDLAITKDEQLVIMHDNNLSRTTNGKGSLTNVTLKELRNFSAGSWFSNKFQKEKVPTFDELVSFLNQTKINLNLEIKYVVGKNAHQLTDSMIKQLALKIDAIDPSIRVIISSFYPEILLKLKKLRPNLEYACLFNQWTFPFWKPITKLIGTNIIHPYTQGLNQRKIKQLKAAGFEVNVWTVDYFQRAMQLSKWGVDGIFTDIGQQFHVKQ